MNKLLGTAGTKIFVGVIVAFAVVTAVVAVITLETTGEKGSGLSKDFIYDLSDIAKIDPNLILYEESSKPFNTGFTESHAIVVAADGTIYVAVAIKPFEYFPKMANCVTKSSLLRRQHV
jgi:hypothetical protein